MHSFIFPSFIIFFRRVAGKFIALLHIIFLLNSYGYAQRYNFTTYTIADGLPNNQINDVLQDKTGRLWVATNNGVCRYDGASFIKFDQNNPISNNPVKKIYEDDKGNIWLGTVRKGVCFFDGINTTFLTSKDGLLSDIINAITKDREGNMWFGTSEGLCMYNGKKFTNFTTRTGLIGNDITSLFTDKAGNVWIGTLSGLIKYSNGKFANYTLTEGLAGNLIYHITQTKDNKIYISTNNGYSIYDGYRFVVNKMGTPPVAGKINHIIEDYKSNKWFATAGGGISMMDDGRYYTFNQSSGLPSDYVQAITEDREGNLWLATSNGLCRYTGDRFVIFTTEEGLASNKIISTYCDSKNNIWFGTTGNGVSYFDGEKIKTVSSEQGLRSSSIWSIHENNNGSYWLGTTNGVALYDTVSGTATYPLTVLENKAVYAIINSQATGATYFGTDEGLFIYKDSIFTHVDSLAGLHNQSVRALYQDMRGTIWIGTLQGMYYLDGIKVISLNEQYKLIKAPVTSITEDVKKQIIFSTFDFGLFVFSPSDKKVNIINSASGINNNRILFSFLDKNSWLWLGTPQGLDRIDWNTYLKRQYINNTHFDKSNGYFGVETNAACSDRNGFVWFGSANGAIRYNPKSGYSKNAIPIVNINSINVFLKEVDWSKENFTINSKTGLPLNPVLSYGSNNLTFYFTGIYLTAPIEVQYRWKLVGFDDYWSPITKYALANYSNIPPGSYDFIVQATANSRDWSPEVTYHFIMKPPIWRTIGAYILYTLTGILLIFLLLWFRTRSLRQSQIILRNKVNERTIELKEKNLELAKLSLVASETENAVMIFDNNMELEWVNNGFTKMTGFTQDEFVSQKGVNIRQLTYNENIERMLDDCVAFKKSFVYESMMIKKDGKKMVTSSTLTPVFNEKGKLKNLVVIDTDITLRTNMEEQIRKSLEEKGFLLKEIHHRVKNNLQIIISLFNLQSNYIDDEKAAKAIREGQDRIRSMALIHDRFYQSEGMTRIDFDEYINRLCETLVHSSGDKEQKITLLVDAEKISLDIDTAVPCGLIINEIVSNSVKHAFKGIENKIIKVDFKRSDQNYMLSISDNGAGLAPQFDFENADTLGMQLVNALVSQIEGTLTVKNENGLSIQILFKQQH